MSISLHITQCNLNKKLQKISIHSICMDQGPQNLVKDFVLHMYFLKAWASTIIQIYITIGESLVLIFELSHILREGNMAEDSLVKEEVL